MVLDSFGRKEVALWGMLGLLVAVGWCGGEKEPPLSERYGDVRAVPPGSETAPPPMSSEATPDGAETITTPAVRGVVLANRELGMSVGGQGADNPERSLDVLEQQVVTFLPELRDAYERERDQDPALMGSLDVNMTIEPNGGVSDLRFPVKRVSNERLTSAVFNQMRAWTFPPAELPVQLRFSLLFVPPDMDEVSILLWERRLGSRPIIEKAAETPSPVAVAAAHSPEKKLGEGTPQKRREEPVVSKNAQAAAVVKDPVPAAAPQAKKKEESPPHEITGWYRVLYPSVLRSEPQSSAKVVAQLQRGLRVQVVKVVKDQWLEVRSITDRPSGFLWWEDAILERANQKKR